MSYSSHLRPDSTPQTEPLNGQIANSGGGYGWAISDWERFDRFLYLGSEGGTYYASERKLTIENAKSVIELIKKDPVKVLERIEAVIESGSAPKIDPALFCFSLVLAYASPEGKKIAYEQIPSFCKTGTHLFMLMEHIKNLRKWSRGLRTGVASWYQHKAERHQLIYQLLKYKQRNGWSHKDVLRLCHLNPSGQPFGQVDRDILAYTVGKEHSEEILKVSKQFKAYSALQIIANLQRQENCGLIALSEEGLKEITEARLTHEMIPTEFLKSSEIWKALLKEMPMHAMVRNLGRMTGIGLLKDLGDEHNLVIDRLMDAELVKKSKLHPVTLLNAVRVYAKGRGDKGSLTWKPLHGIIGGLNTAFTHSFGNVEPTKKRICIGLDVSGSMDGSYVAGTALTAREAACALAFITARVEPYVQILCFSNTLVQMGMPKTATLEQMIKAVKDLPFSGTDCALPITNALKNKIPVDCFIIYTDNETNSNSIHPKVALDIYRKEMQIDAKLIVVAMTANEVSIADPNDKGMLDIAGFNTSVPTLISSFIKGEMTNDTTEVVQA